MLKILLILSITGWKLSDGLSCYTCSNEPSFDSCFKRGRITRCRPNEKSCQTEVLRFNRPHGTVYSVSKRCKQSDACTNNAIQNPRAAWLPSQCNLKYPSSVCRCCCNKEKCNYGGIYCMSGPSCNQIPAIKENGLTRCTLGRNEDSVCKNECEPDHILIGDKQFSCERRNGNTLTWNTTKAAFCRSTTCNKNAIVIKNGFSSCTDGNREGSVCEFFCRAGYVLQNGWPVASCNSIDNETSVEWDSDIPTCERITCLVLKAPLNGYLHCDSSNRIGSVCITKCKKGYRRFGKKSTTCQLNNFMLPPIWSNTPTPCVRISCPLLAQPKNGKVECTKSNLFESQCKYFCDSDYMLSQDENLLTCTDQQIDGNGKWNHEVPFCRSSRCPSTLTAPAKGAFSCTNRNNYGSVCTFSCNHGYELVGNSRIACVDTPSKIISWESKSPVCRIKTCSLVQTNPSNGAVTCTETNNFGSICEFACNIGYALSGSTVTQCAIKKGERQPTWTFEQPMCEKLVCPPMSAPKNGKLSCDNDVLYGSVCSFICDVGYTLIGSSKSLCRDADKNKIGDWSFAAPVCQIKTCPSLPAFSNGDILCTDGYNFKSACTYNCREGYHLTGLNVLSCDGKVWSSTAPVCKRIMCDPVAGLRHGDFKCRGKEYGDTCTFECNMEYWIDGQKAVTCIDRNQDGVGEWSGAMPICQPITCPENNLQSGKISCTKGNLYTSTCSFTCDQGFMRSGVEQIECEKSGNVGIWGDSMPVCKDLICPSVASPKNGSISCTRNRLYGSICAFKCDVGFRLVGEDSITCQDVEDIKIGKWSSGVPICQILECESMPPVANGIAECTTGNDFGSVCTHSCNTGYFLIGNKQSECDGWNWSSDVPFCKRITCNSLPPLSNGDFTCTGTEHGDLCTLECNIEYQMVGSDARICEDKNNDGEGEWSDSMPKCEPIHCPQLSLSDGDISCSKGTLFTSTCSFACDIGYKISGVDTMQCTKVGNVGTWEAPAPQCNKLVCPLIDTPLNGTITCDHGELYGSTCSFSCDIGFKLIGEDSILCGNVNDIDVGTWDGNAPVCQILRCDVLPQLLNGYMECTTGNSYGSICEYACLTGYHLVGKSQTECDGESWSSIEPFCKRITCAALPQLTNGEFTCTGTEHGDDCNLKCAIEYYLDGSGTLSCGDENGDGDGEWSDSMPTCRPIHCPDLLVEDGQFSCTKGTLYTSACTFTCDPGFKLSGARGIQCNNLENEGRWSSPTPSCSDLICPEISTPNNGKMVCTKNTVHGSTCSFDCDVGYRMIGEPSAECRDDDNNKVAEWTNKEPICEVMRCSAIPVFLDGVVSCTRENKYGSTCTYSCNSGYHLTGEMETECDGISWSSPAPYCKRIICDPIASLQNGNVQCSGSEFGDVCTFTCAMEYYVDGSTTTSCGDKNKDGEGEWSSELPTCKAITCPGLVVEDGQMNCTKGNLYSSVCSFQCRENFKRIGSWQIRCDKRGRFGHWSAPAPKCQIKHCSRIKAPPEGFMTCTNDTNIDSQCSFTCTERRRVYPRGSEVLTCLDSEEWDNPIPCCYEHCPPNAVMDMIILIDSSSSITRRNFNMVINFVKTLVKKFEVSDSMTKFGVFRYNQFVDQQNEIRLNSYHTVDELLRKIDKIPYNGFGTWTGKALQHAIDSSLHISSGNRVIAPDAILLITDGVTNPLDDLVTPTNGIHRKDVRFLAVFVPPIDRRKRKLGIEQLASITGSRDNVVLVEKGFDSLLNITTSVEDFACQYECHRDDIVHYIDSVPVNFELHAHK